jgi:type IV pilus assembly protein PilE
MNTHFRVRDGQSGFTLTELMITLVVATILVGVAIPAYTLQMRKSRRTEAKSAVMDLATREEQFFSTNNAYSTDPTLLGYAAVGSGAAFPQSTGQYYQITVVVNNGVNPATFTVTAAPSAGSAQLTDAQCTAFSVDQSGSQTATGTLGNACWP